MELRLTAMTDAYAREIAGWRYPEPYAVYNLDGDPAAATELMNGEYRAALDGEGHLAGFFCFGNSARVPCGHAAGVYRLNALDIGLGLRPDLAGRGAGFDFLQAGIAYAADVLGADRLRLSVLEFNRRAIAVYRRSGFLPHGEFVAPRNTGLSRFLVLVKVL